MNPLELSIKQLKRAAAIKEQIEALNRELRGILGGLGNFGVMPKKKHSMSAAVKKKIAASQKARWAKIKNAKRAVASARAGAGAKKTATVKSSGR